MGRRRWKKASGYQRQARVENAFFRYEARSLRAGPAPSGYQRQARAFFRRSLGLVFGSGRRRARSKRAEARLACNVLNQMTELGRPASYSIGR